MINVLYVSDSNKKSIEFINDLISDLNEFGIKNIRHDREHNLIVVRDIEVRGISLCEGCLCLKIWNTKYFIDGIDMRNYKDASKEKLEWLIWHVKEVISHFEIGVKQLDGKDELIKILAENVK